MWVKLPMGIYSHSLRGPPLNKGIGSVTCSINSLPFHYWWRVRGKNVLLT